MLGLEVAMEAYKKHQDGYPDEGRAERLAQVA